MAFKNDMTMMYAVHDALRRELDRIEAVPGNVVAVVELGQLLLRQGSATVRHPAQGAPG